MKIKKESPTEKMWRKNPYCFYCGIKTTYDKGFYKRKVPNQAATIEHLYSKHNPIKGTSIKRKRKVIACFKCNTEKGSLDELIFRKENVSREKDPKIRKKDTPKWHYINSYFQKRQKILKMIELKYENHN